MGTKYNSGTKYHPECKEFAEEYEATRRGRPTGAFKHTDKEIGELLLKHSGYQTMVAQELDVDLPFLYKRIARSPYLQSIKNSCVETRLDRAEQALDIAVAQVNVPAIQFFLKQKGKSRGYGQNHTLEEEVGAVLDEKMSAYLDEMKNYRKSRSSAPSKETIT